MWRRRRRRIMTERNFVALMLKWERLRVLTDPEQVLKEASMPFCDMAAGRFYTAVHLGPKCGEQKKHKEGFFSSFLPYFSVARRQDGDAAAKGILRGAIKKKKKKINIVRESLNYVFPSAGSRQKYPSRCHLVNITHSLSPGRSPPPPPGHHICIDCSGGEVETNPRPNGGRTSCFFHVFLCCLESRGRLQERGTQTETASLVRLCFPRCDAPAL